MRPPQLNNPELSHSNSQDSQRHHNHHHHYNPPYNRNSSDATTRLADGGSSNEGAQATKGTDVTSNTKIISQNNSTHQNHQNHQNPNRIQRPQSRLSTSTSTSSSTDSRPSASRRSLTPQPSPFLSPIPSPIPSPLPSPTPTSTPFSLPSSVRRQTSLKSRPPRPADSVESNLRPASAAGAAAATATRRPKIITTTIVTRNPPNPTNTTTTTTTPATTPATTPRLAPNLQHRYKHDNNNNNNLPLSPNIINSTASSRAAALESLTSPLAPPLTPSLASTPRLPHDPLRSQNADHMKAKTLEIGLPKVGAGPGTGTRTRTTMASHRASMPPERSNSANNKPQMPSLSASAARATNKTPLMPKLASKPQPPALATATPASRRSQRPPAAPSNKDTATPQPTTQHDELLASMPPSLAVNVTPRSGARQTRVDSIHTTPAGTPNTERFDLGDHKITPGHVSPPARPDYATRKPAVSFGTLPHESNNHGREQHASESKFFHASDVQAAPRPPAATKQEKAKQATFFYANGNNLDNRPNMPAATQSQDSIASKFMYANGRPEVQASSLSVPLARVSTPTTAPSAQKHTSGRLSIGSQVSAVHHGARPSSPTKSPSQPLHSPLMSSAMAPTAGTQRGQPSPLPGSAAERMMRRTSSGASRTARAPHSRSGSLVLTDLGHNSAVTTPKLMSPQFASGPSSPLHTPSTPQPLTLASIIQAAEELPDNDESHSADESRSDVQSPGKSSSGDPANELVANARRERKVQDLQITNASLEAINRTLERQLRKQTAEIRRYKRLSRSGHLSQITTEASSRVASEALAPEEEEPRPRIASMSDDEESDAEDEEEEEPEEESLSDTESDTENLSPEQMAERDEKHRNRDEKRLKLDLTKHQQLLVDSQKINQSIRRCLDWTEELIKDGKKALAYKVQLSDVKLGGKVLSPLDEPDEDLSSRQDDDDDIVDSTAKLDSLLAEVGRISDFTLDQPQDRDSGIEMPVDGG